MQWDCALMLGFARERQRAAGTFCLRDHAPLEGCSCNAAGCDIISLRWLRSICDDAQASVSCEASRST